MFWKKKKNDNSNLNMKFELDYVVKTDTGLIRDNNEDSVKCINFNDDKNGFLAIVADGMGGHKSGEVASKMAIDLIPDIYYETDGYNLVKLETAFLKTNNAIYEKSNSENQYSGMGTTCTAVVLKQNKLYFAHVGDSRLYLFRDNELTQLSTDHTLVQKMLDEGSLTTAEANNYPQKNIIWQAMGTAKSLKVQMNKKPLEIYVNDRLLLCSDGLTDMLNDSEIKQILQMKSLNMVASCLIALAKEKGGYDNISIIIIEIKKYKRNIEKRDTKEF